MSTRTARKTVPELAPVTVSELDGVRTLHLGTPWVQGAMRIKQPDEIELEYVQRMMAWMLFRPAEHVTHGHAVQLGLGAAAITKFCRRKLKMRTTAVELNPEVIAACRSMFRLPEDDARLSVLNLDAADYVADPQNAGRAAVLCVDLYDHEAASPVLDSAEFYAGCHRLLGDGGVMTVNLFGSDSSYPHSVEQMAASFGEDALWSLRPTREGNTVVVGLKGVEAPTRALMAERAENVEARFGLPARKWVRMVRQVKLG